MSKTVSIKQIRYGTKEQNEVLAKFDIKVEWKIKDFLEQFSKDVKGKYYVLKSNKKDKSSLTSSIVDSITKQNVIFIESKQIAIKIIEYDQEKGSQQTLDQEYLVDISIKVRQLSEQISKKFGFSCTVLKFDKSKADLEALLQNVIQLNTIYINTSKVKIKLQQIIDSKTTKLFKVVKQDSNMKVSDFISRIEEDLGYDIIIYETDKVTKAGKSRKISDLMTQETIYIKFTLVNITVFCQSNRLLPKFAVKADLGWTISEFKQKNQSLQKYDFLDKNNSIVQGVIKLEEVVQNKDGSIFFKYKQKDQESAREGRLQKMGKALERLEKINQNVKKLSKQNSESANKQMGEATNAMKDLMERLTKDVGYIREKDFNLMQKIRIVDKQQGSNFVSRLYKVADLYTPQMLLEQTASRIFWPFYKNSPFEIRKRIIDFQKSTVQITNVHSYEEKQTTTRSVSTVKEVERSIQQHMNKLDTSAKAGISTKFFSASLQASYSKQDQNRSDRENNKMSSESKEYIIFNALKKTEGYHIDEEKIVLKDYIKQIVKDLYRLYQVNHTSFKTKAKLFFRNYGTQLQIAKYIFGCRYSFNSMAQTHQETTEKKLSSVSRTVRSMGLSAQAQGGGIFFSASGGFSIKNTSGQTNSNLNNQMKVSESYSFQINYNLEGLQVKNRDTWRQLSGIYRKGWKCFAFEDLRFVKMVDILNNPGNQIHNPSYKKSYQEFLSEMQKIEKNLENGSDGINEEQNKAELTANIQTNGFLSFSSKKTIQNNTILFIQKKTGNIQYFESFKSSLEQILNSNKEEQIQWISNGYNIKIKKTIILSSTINKSLAKINISIDKN